LHEFFTSGANGNGRRRQVASSFEPATDQFGLIVLSQARTAPASTDADGVSMRVWAATLAKAWIAKFRHEQCYPLANPFSLPRG